MDGFWPERLDDGAIVGAKPRCSAAEPDDTVYHNLVVQLGKTAAADEPLHATLLLSLVASEAAGPEGKRFTVASIRRASNMRTTISQLLLADTSLFTARLRHLPSDMLATLAVACQVDGLTDSSPGLAHPALQRHENNALAKPGHSDLANSLEPAMLERLGPASFTYAVRGTAQPHFCDLPLDMQSRFPMPLPSNYAVYYHCLNQTTTRATLLLGATASPDAQQAAYLTEYNKISLRWAQLVLALECDTSPSTWLVAASGLPVAYCHGANRSYGLHPPLPAAWHVVQLDPEYERARNITPDQASIDSLKVLMTALTDRPALARVLEAKNTRLVTVSNQQGYVEIKQRHQRNAGIASLPISTTRLAVHGWDTYIKTAGADGSADAIIAQNTTRVALLLLSDASDKRYPWLKDWKTKYANLKSSKDQREFVVKLNWCSTAKAVEELDIGHALKETLLASAKGSTTDALTTIITSYLKGQLCTRVVHRTATTTEGSFATAGALTKQSKNRVPNVRIARHWEQIASFTEYEWYADFQLLAMCTILVDGDGMDTTGGPTHRTCQKATPQMKTLVDAIRNRMAGSTAVTASFSHDLLRFEQSKTAAARKKLYTRTTHVDLVKLCGQVRPQLDVPLPAVFHANIDATGNLGKSGGIGRGTVWADDILAPSLFDGEMTLKLAAPTQTQPAVDVALAQPQLATVAQTLPADVAQTQPQLAEAQTQPADILFQPPPAPTTATIPEGWTYYDSKISPISPDVYRYFENDVDAQDIEVADLCGIRPATRGSFSSGASTYAKYRTANTDALGYTKGWRVTNPSLPWMKSVPKTSVEFLTEFVKHAPGHDVRQLQRYLGLPDRPHVRDHGSITQTYRRLNELGLEAINTMVLSIPMRQATTGVNLWETRGDLPTQHVLCVHRTAGPGIDGIVMATTATKSMRGATGGFDTVDGKPDVPEDSTASTTSANQWPWRKTGCSYTYHLAGRGRPSLSFPDPVIVAFRIACFKPRCQASLMETFSWQDLQDLLQSPPFALIYHEPLVLPLVAVTGPRYPTYSQTLAEKQGFYSSGRWNAARAEGVSSITLLNCNNYDPEGLRVERTETTATGTSTTTHGFREVVAVGYDSPFYKPDFNSDDDWSQFYTTTLKGLTEEKQSVLEDSLKMLRDRLGDELLCYRCLGRLGLLPAHPELNVGLIPTQLAPTPSAYTGDYKAALTALADDSGDHKDRAAAAKSVFLSLADVVDSRLCIVDKGSNRVNVLTGGYDYLLLVGIGTDPNRLLEKLAKAKKTTAHVRTLMFAADGKTAPLQTALELYSITDVSIAGHMVAMGANIQAAFSRLSLTALDISPKAATVDTPIGVIEAWRGHLKAPGGTSRRFNTEFWSHIADFLVRLCVAGKLDLLPASMRTASYWKLVVAAEDSPSPAPVSTLSWAEMVKTEPMFIAMIGSYTDRDAIDNVVRLFFGRYYGTQALNVQQDWYDFVADKKLRSLAVAPAEDSRLAPLNTYPRTPRFDQPQPPSTDQYTYFLKTIYNAAASYTIARVPTLAPITCSVDFAYGVHDILYMPHATFTIDRAAGSGGAFSVAPDRAKAPATAQLWQPTISESLWALSPDRRGITVIKKSVMFLGTGETFNTTASFIDLALGDSLVSVPHTRNGHSGPATVHLIRSGSSIGEDLGAATVMVRLPGDVISGPVAQIPAEQVFHIASSTATAEHSAEDSPPIDADNITRLQAQAGAVLDATTGTVRITGAIVERIDPNFVARNELDEPCVDLMAQSQHHVVQGQYSMFGDYEAHGFCGTPMTAQYLALIAAYQYSLLSAVPTRLHLEQVFATPENLAYHPLAVSNRNFNPVDDIRKRINACNYTTADMICAIPWDDEDHCGRCDTAYSVGVMQGVPGLRRLDGTVCSQHLFCRTCIAGTDAIICERPAIMTYAPFLKGNGRPAIYKLSDMAPTAPVKDRLDGICVGCVRYAPWKRATNA